MIRVGIETSSLNGSSQFRGIGMYSSRLITALEHSEEVEVAQTAAGGRLDNIDILHYPYFDFFFLTLPLVKKVKTVVTIHDCIPLVFPDKYPTGIKGKIKFSIQKYSLKNVDAVLTDSESSKKDIMEFLNVPKEKINVVYLAADPIFKKLPNGSEILGKVSRKYKLPSEYMLYVGDVNYNKNLIRLIDAFSKVDDENFHLVMVGKSFENKILKETKQILNLIEALNISKRVHLPGFIPDEDLLVIYNLAKIYCMPSLYEGFGLQILEAMACGVPVITSGVSSTSEISGKAALLVNPLKTEEISAAIKKLMADKLFRDKMIKLGSDQVNNFSWNKTAQETINVYRKVLYD